MGFNGFVSKPNSELSEYQKKIEAIDNVILCVAEAERMLREIGASLILEHPPAGTNSRKPSKPTRLPWTGRTNPFQ